MQLPLMMAQIQIGANLSGLYLVPLPGVLSSGLLCGTTSTFLYQLQRLPSKDMAQAEFIWLILQLEKDLKIEQSIKKTGHSLPLYFSYSSVSSTNSLNGE